MATAAQVPATQQKMTPANNIRNLLERSRKQIESTLPKHLTADRLLRVAMTSIQKTPKLLECTPKSLLACVMTCAQLGLEPDQFLGQAYLVPYGKDCTLIPGYRGYIALARRSGELQTLSAQVVYSNDEFNLQYGVEDTLMHKPSLNGRGEPIGAYCVFKYKDGGYSFDWMSRDDIEKVRARSKAANNGPWVTDWDEMAKKTVIKRHAKLAPLSVEFQKAVALEERALSGESQADLLNPDDDVVDAEIETKCPEEVEAEFTKATADRPLMAKYLQVAAKHFKKAEGDIKAEAVKDMAGFLAAYDKWAAGQKQKEELKKADEKAPEVGTTTTERFECAKGGFVTADICAACKDRNAECEKLIQPK